MQSQMFPYESSWRTVDDSLSGNDKGESPQSGGIATLNRPAKSGFFLTRGYNHYIQRFASSCS